MKINLDFDITSTIYLLHVEDLSCWGLIQDKPAVISITLPGSTYPVKDYFDKDKKNSFDASTLGLSCQGCDDQILLPDGIYEIKLEGSPSTFFQSKLYLKTDELKMKIDKAWISNMKSQKSQDKLVEALLLIQGAESHIRYEMEKEAKNLYDQALKIVTKLSGCKNC